MQSPTGGVALHLAGREPVLFRLMLCEVKKASLNQARTRAATSTVYSSYLKFGICSKLCPTKKITIDNVMVPHPPRQVAPSLHAGVTHVVMDPQDSERHALIRERIK